jgi:hypothetical protein
MGHGSYSSHDHTIRATAAGYYDKSAADVFVKRALDNAMSPVGLKIRESRDSADHPESLAVIIALDVTGSMHTVPHELVKNGLPNIMDRIFKEGVKDPQILFLGIGDHKCDQAPLQVSQFESSDELLDKWLTNVFLEGGGGGNGGESYMLAWYLAAHHTSIDCQEKRDRKGLLFTIGDEPIHGGISKESLDSIMGPGEHKNYTSAELLKEAQEKYHVYHIHIKETLTGSQRSTAEGWKDLIGENFIVVDSHKDVPKVIAEKILSAQDHNHVVADAHKQQKILL